MTFGIQLKVGVLVVVIKGDFFEMDLGASHPGTYFLKPVCHFLGAEREIIRHIIPIDHRVVDLETPMKFKPPLLA